MQRELIDPRIARMIQRDKKVAIASVVALWLISGFVFWQLVALVGSSAFGPLTVTAFAGLGILLLTTVSIYEMIQRCSSDAEIARIYGCEIQCDEIVDCDPTNSWLA